MTSEAIDKQVKRIEATGLSKEGRVEIAKLLSSLDSESFADSLTDALVRIAGTYGPINDGLKVELARVMKQAQTEHQLTVGVEQIILEVDRQFCPKPGHLLAAIQDAPLSPPTDSVDPPDWVTVEAESCWACRNTGYIQIAGTKCPCSCAWGDDWAQEHPVAVEHWHTKSDEAAEKIRQWKAQPRRRRQRGLGQAKTSQILGRLT